MAADQGSNRTKTGRYQPGTSGNMQGRPTRGRVNEQELTARREKILTRLDGWNNTVTGLGILGKDKATHTGFSVDIVDAELGAQLWRGDAIGARIVELFPNEMLRQGYELCIGDDDVTERYTPPEPEAPPEPGQMAPTQGGAKALQTQRKRNDALASTRYGLHISAYQRRVKRAITRERRDAGDAKPLQESICKKFRDLQVDVMIREALHFERAVCAGALLIGANDYTTDLRLPLDLRKVRSLDYLTPIEARELQPLYWYNDPFAAKFGQVAIYQLVPTIIGTSLDGQWRNGITQIHESRLIVFPGIRTTRRNMQGAMNGFGDNVFTRCFRALRQYNSINQNTEILMSDFAQAIYKIKGLADLLMRDKNALTDAMMNVELGRAIARAVVIDSEEDFERKSTSLAGYADVMDRSGTNVCAAADTPATLLLGISPAGMNATGASDIRFFYDRVATGQTMRVAPAVMRLTEIALAAQGEDPDSINHSITFHPLWQPTQLEIAEARNKQMQTDTGYIAAEVLSPEETALSRFGGEQYSFETRIDFEARHEQESIAPPTVEARPPKPSPFLYPTGVPPGSPPSVDNPIIPEE